MIGRILVFGRSGQLASALRRVAGERGVDLVALGRAEADISQRAAITEAFDSHRPALVVNAAAYTAVDRAETDEERAFHLNAAAPGVMAARAAGRGLPFIHISTDYVFDGDLRRPYKEGDTVAPINAYGRSKEAGEAAVVAAGGNHLILRTSWIYSETGTNFVRTMLRLAAEREEIKVVDDQRGCPTYAGDLAEAIMDLAKLVAAGELRSNVYHLAAGGDASWFEFAQEVFRQASACGLPAPKRLIPIPSDQWPTEARRPRNSVLDCSALAHDYGIALEHWRDGLTRMLSSLPPTAATNRLSGKGDE